MSNDAISIEYNRDLEALEKLLSGVQRPGDFYCSGVVEIPMPKLEADGVGMLSFPVPPVQIEQLIAQATRAPYGRGEKTVYDEAVRKVWQLPAEMVRIGGKSWDMSFGEILCRAVSGLGCEGFGVSAELYKLLIYDTGSFFLAHRDTEKAEGMFATMVLVLPSMHEGGELLIRHQGREIALDLSRMEPSEVSFAAFYADCEHEVRPVTSGNRVCLVYNLMHAKGKKGTSGPLQAPAYENQIEASAALLRQHLTEPGGSVKIAWLLEHQYSPEGLSFAELKSSDAARVKVLLQAAEVADCVGHLGIVHIEESGSAMENYDGYHRGWGRYEEEDVSSDDFEVVDVDDFSHFVDQWRDSSDQPKEFGEIPLKPGELLPRGALDGEAPDDQRLLESTGNAGATFERSYHRAALVLWRKERHAEVLLQAGVSAAMPYFEEVVAKVLENGSSEVARREAIALARSMITSWNNSSEYSSVQNASRPKSRHEMLRLLRDLDDIASIEGFLTEVMLHDYDGTENEELLAIASRIGPEATGRIYASLVCEQMPAQHENCVMLLRALLSLLKLSPSGFSSQAWLDALLPIAETAVRGLDAIEKKENRGGYDFYSSRAKSLSVRPELVSTLMDVLGELSAPSLRQEAAEKLTARFAVFDPVTVLVPALERVRSYDFATYLLWEKSAAFLLERSASPPEAPKDWRQEVTIACRCEDCRELERFALNPVEQIHRFRVRQDRRDHLQTQIGVHGLDMGCVTDRKGSPQTLVCTKDRRTYQRRCEEYRKDIHALGSLENLAGEASGTNSTTLEKITSALKLGREWSPS